MPTLLFKHFNAKIDSFFFINNEIMHFLFKIDGNPDILLMVLLQI